MKREAGRLTDRERLTDWLWDVVAPWLRRWL